MGGLVTAYLGGTHLSEGLMAWRAGAGVVTESGTKSHCFLSFFIALIRLANFLVISKELKF